MPEPYYSCLSNEPEGGVIPPPLIIAMNNLWLSGTGTIVPYIAVNNVSFRILPSNCFITQFERFQVGTAHTVRSKNS